MAIFGLCRHCPQSFRDFLSHTLDLFVGNCDFLLVSPLTRKIRSLLSQACFFLSAVVISGFFAIADEQMKNQDFRSDTLHLFVGKSDCFGNSLSEFFVVRFAGLYHTRNCSIRSG